MKPPAGPPITATIDAQGRLALRDESMQELGLELGSAVSLRAADACGLGRDPAYMNSGETKYRDET